MNDGALFSAAYSHAAQGDGESGGTGIETSATATLSLSSNKKHENKVPSSDRKSEFQKMSTHDGNSDDLYKASQIAMDGMINELGRRGISGGEGYTLCSLAADLRISEMVDEPNHVVSMTIPLDIIERS